MAVEKAHIGNIKARHISENGIFLWFLIIFIYNNIRDKKTHIPYHKNISEYNFVISEKKLLIHKKLFTFKRLAVLIIAIIDTATGAKTILNVGAILLLFSHTNLLLKYTKANISKYNTNAGPSNIRFINDIVFQKSHNFNHNIDPDIIITNIQTGGINQDQFTFSILE